MNTRQATANSGNRIAFGALIVIVSLFCFLCIVGALGGVGKMVYGFLVGFFGLADYAYAVVGLILGVATIFNFRTKMPISKILFLVGLFALGVLALQVYTSSSYIDANYGAYLMKCYNGTNTAGGMLFGVLAFPLMKFITPVGALALVCALFFALAGVMIVPYIKKNTTTYNVATSAERDANSKNHGNMQRAFKFGAKNQRGEGVIGRPTAPVITDFSSGNEDGKKLFVLNVDGSPVEKSDRKAKGANGYNPLYPNFLGNIEDEEIAQPQEDKYSPASYARDLLFSQNPSDDSLERFNTTNNPTGAMKTVSPPYSATKRSELKSKLGIDTSEDAVKQSFRMRYKLGDSNDEAKEDSKSGLNGANAKSANFGGSVAENGVYGANFAEKSNFAKGDVQASPFGGIAKNSDNNQDNRTNSNQDNRINNNQESHTSSLLGYDFDTIKAEQKRRFAEMYSEKVKPEFEATAYKSPEDESNVVKATPIKKELVKPTKIMQKSDFAYGEGINSTINKAQNAVQPQSNLAGLSGVVARAINGEQAPLQKPKQDVQADAYDRPNVPVAQAEVSNRPNVPAGQVEEYNRPNASAVNAEASNRPNVKAGQAEEYNRLNVSAVNVEASNRPNVSVAQTEKVAVKIPRAFEGSTAQKIDKSGIMFDTPQLNLDRRPNLNDGENSSQTFASKQDMASIPKNLPKAGETFEHAEMSAKINAIKQDGATNLQQPQFGNDNASRQQQFGNDNASRQPQFGNDNASRQPQARKDTYPLSSFGETDRQREDKMRAGQGRGIGGYQADSAQVSQSKNNNLDNKNNDFNNRNNALNNRNNNFNNSNNGNNRNNDFNNKSNGIGNNGNNFNNRDKQEERLTQVNIEQAISQVTPRTPYVAPPLSLLLPPEARSTSKEEIEHAKVAITNTLLNQFDIVSEVVDVLPGPTLTLYTLSVQLPKGKLLGSMTAYAGNLAKEIPAESVRIIAPIPGKNAVGIEVSNKYRTKVVLSETLMSPAFNLAKAPATFAVGKNTYGKDVVCNIKDMPHVLIAGATASGKSCCINSIIVSFLYKASPDDVRLILIDPKRMELSVYDGIPHLLLPEIIYDIDKAIRALNWCIAEMDRRKKYLGDLRYRNIDEYNADCAKQGYQKMPRIIIIVDELADLMDMGKKAVEDSLNRLARLARAVGIHLVLATQRPSVDVIPGTIKNNLPTRIAFKLTSAVDSGTMLGTNGAEDLLGNGDLLFMSSTSSSLERMQGAYVSNEEVQKVVDFVKENNSCFFDNNIQDEIFKEKEEAKPEAKDRSTKKQSNMPSGIFDALSLGVELEGAPITISNMQRRLSFGWPKAAKIYDAMDNLGFLSQSEKDPRAKYVNISQAELDALIRENSDEDDGE